VLAANPEGSPQRVGSASSVLPQQAGKIYLSFVRIRIRQQFAAALLAMAPALSGCLWHTRIVPKTRPADIVMSTSLDQLIKQLNTHFEAIQSMQATVQIVATTGGSHIGSETQYPNTEGFIWLRKPDDLRVIMKLPLLGSQAMDMVSIGCNWKLWIPPKNRAMDGTCNSTTTEKGLYSLRPAVFFDSMLVKGIDSNQLVSLTSDTRVIETGKKKGDLVEEPDYDIEVLTTPEGQTVHTLRVIHISRTDLRPYQQDIYDASGNIVTRAFYSGYQKYGDVWYPLKIVIQRPLDQLKLSITIAKLTLNQPMADDQFTITIPSTVPIQHMH
jgi:outer membrane lipoprotein-sorting protein